MSDAQKRAAYDRFGHQRADGAGAGFDPGFSNIEDIFDIFGFGDMFGGRRRTRTSVQRGSDLRYDLEITLEEAATGKDENFEIPRLETCENCDGSGAEKGSQPEDLHHLQRLAGRRDISRDFSASCGRAQIVRAEARSLEIRASRAKVPAGSKRRKRSRSRFLPALRRARDFASPAKARRASNGGPSGDLFVVLHVKEHEMFERQGANLYSAVPVSFAQAALGAEIKVTTLDGEEDLKIPAGTQTGTVFQVKVQGMPALGGRGNGDLFVAVTLITPKSLTKEQRKLLEQLSKIEDTEFTDESFMEKVRNIFN